MDPEISAWSEDFQSYEPIRPYQSFVVEAVQASCPKGLDPEVFGWCIIGIGRRETGWGLVKGLNGSTGPSIVGEDGHGRGLMQVDDRYHPLDNWADPRTNILAGAAILAQCLIATCLDLDRAFDDYNAGLRALQATNPDSVTTGKNYGQDVLSFVQAHCPGV